MPKTHHTSINIDSETRAQVIALLNQQLADTFDLFSQTKQAHWNVKGLHFIHWMKLRPTRRRTRRTCRHDRRTSHGSWWHRARHGQDVIGRIDVKASILMLPLPARTALRPLSIGTPPSRRQRARPLTRPLPLAISILRTSSR